MDGLLAVRLQEHEQENHADAADVDDAHDPFAELPGGIAAL